MQNRRHTRLYHRKPDIKKVNINNTKDDPSSIVMDVNMIIELLSKGESLEEVKDDVLRLQKAIVRGNMQDLVIKAEKADILEDYGLYMNLADAIDSQAKKEVERHLITETEWRKLIRRYEL